jgi:hypothetical protein
MKKKKRRPLSLHVIRPPSCIDDPPAMCYYLE